MGQTGSSRLQRMMTALACLVGLAISFAVASEWLRGQESKPATPANAVKTAKATFAGGCFWCMEPPYDKLDGVLSTTSGYTGGRIENPTYKQVSTGRTGHIESIQITYDPERVDYETLLSVFWHNIDPTKANGQFCDDGNQYRSAIFYHDGEQRQSAEASKKRIAEQLDARVHTEIAEAKTFYAAEDEHQDYYRKNPLKYKFYRLTCGRDARLNALWGDKAGKP